MAGSGADLGGVGRAGDEAASGARATCGTSAEGTLSAYEMMSGAALLARHASGVPFPRRARGGSALLVDYASWFLFSCFSSVSKYSLFIRFSVAELCSLVTFLVTRQLNLQRRSFAHFILPPCCR